MDVLSALLDGPRAQGAFLLRSVWSAPWGLRIEDEAPLTLVAVVRGSAWVTVDGEAPVHLDRGDVALVRGPRHYVVTDEVTTRPPIVIHPGQRCTTLDGVELQEPMSLGVRTWGNDLHGPTILLTGTYQQHTEVGQRVLGALPDLVVVPAERWDTPLVALLEAEIAKDGPGQEAVLDRLLDLLLIAALRLWLALPDAPAPGWFRAHGDAIVGPAVSLLHNNPGHPWTVASLAAELGVSRAALSRRFSELVGEPPMTFLTGWRLDLAADLLRDPQLTLAAVAHQVGYGSPFALSAAFKRERGVSPSEHRRAVA